MASASPPKDERSYKIIFMGREGDGRQEMFECLCDKATQNHDQRVIQRQKDSLTFICPADEDVKCKVLANLLAVESEWHRQS